ncbi:uncharacterized protein EI97DRAFT_445050 [Westerdykella ornata]|uniref:Uncharacterized protein n=1 Tax=Westerdykella ornata TaxID=318751 RepID=A0A6A6JAW0_WESOR|nr:uncharacterized protein EI97DRAFT_445050 [Westerdykella ornata]KAF2273313.1 hypothetical protein EI97DRAFT_445050 [Westerdykella ornata]
MDRDPVSNTLSLMSNGSPSSRTSGGSHRGSGGTHRGVSLNPPKNQRLPADEYRYLQTRHTLEKHFGGRSPAMTSRSDASSSLSMTKSTSSKHSSSSSSNKKDSRLTHDQRTSVSEIRYATRKALGPSFDFTDTYVAPKRKTTRHHYGNDEEAGKEHIPQRYIDEFNRRWVQDDFEEDAHQFVMDCLPNGVAPWRRHQALVPTGVPDRSWHAGQALGSIQGSMALEMANHGYQYRENFLQKRDAGKATKAGELPGSTFDWDDSDDDKDAVGKEEKIEKNKERRDSKLEKVRRKMKIAKK